MAAQPGANAGRNKRRRERQAAEELGPAAADALVHARAGDLAALRAVWSADITSTAATVCLCWAAGGGHLGCVRYLAEERGADAAAHEPRRQRTALHFAARDGRVEVARYLLERCAVPVDAPSVHEITALQLAAWRSQLGTAQLLSAAGARVDCVNSFGCGAGHWAALCEPSLQPAAEEHEALLLLLQEGGADLRAPNSQGHTPLHKAAFAGNLVCCRWLARTLGVLDEREDEAGNYAADMAELGGHAEVRTMMLLLLLLLVLLLLLLAAHGVPAARTDTCLLPVGGVAAGALLARLGRRVLRAGAAARLRRGGGAEGLPRAGADAAPGPGAEC